MNVLISCSQCYVMVCHVRGGNKSVSIPYVFCYFVGNLLGQADGYIAEHALGGGVGDVLQSALEN